MVGDHRRRRVGVVVAIFTPACCQPQRSTSSSIVARKIVRMPQIFPKNESWSCYGQIPPIISLWCPQTRCSCWRWRKVISAWSISNSVVLIDVPCQQWRCQYDSKILNALFYVTGLGLVPWHFRDIYFILKFRL